MDPLTDIFSSLRLERVTHTRLEVSAPWGHRSAGLPDINFVLVQRGACVLTTASYPQAIELAEGDIFMMLAGVPYTLCDAPGSEVMDCADVEKLRVGPLIAYGGGGEMTILLIGAFGLDYEASGPLLAILPPFLMQRAGRTGSQAFRSVLELLALETRQPGLASEALLTSLYELVFIHAVRAYVTSCQAPEGGWLAALSDPYLGLALRALHQDIARPWTVAELAHEAGLSRSAFALRFKQRVGEAPLEYMTRWRIYRAGRLMQRPELTIGNIARAVGYESESAFNRVFKRETGLTPGGFRRRPKPQLAVSGP